MEHECKTILEKPNEKTIDNKSNNSDLLTKTLDQSSTQQQLPATYIATMVEIDSEGYPVVEYQGRNYLAESLVPIADDHLGVQCALAFINGEASRPLILGILWKPNVSSVLDKHVLKAQESIILECGRSSLEMQSDGSVRLKGVTVTTQAYGSNRVKGAAVKIN